MAVNMDTDSERLEFLLTPPPPGESMDKAKANEIKTPKKRRVQTPKKKESPPESGAKVVFSDTSEEEAVLSFIEGLSDKAALAVIKAYRSMPEHLKEAVRCVYDEVRFLGVATTIESLKDALIDLKEMCGERWFTMYKETLKDIKKIVPEILKGQSVEELG